MIRCETEYPLNIVKNGCSYFYSPALQLAKNLIGERSHCIQNKNSIFGV